MENQLKIAVITGAARGIGYGIAMRFRNENYRVIMLDIDNNTLNETKEKLKNETDFDFYCVDIANDEQVKEVFGEIIAKYNRIDALVNNAGIAIFKKAEEITFLEWSNIMNTNLNGPFLCTQAALAGLLNAKGAVVNIASISGLRASTLRIAYGTSKAALIHLTKQQAVEYGNQGVRVNAVAPGPVETEMAKLVHSADIRTSYHDAIPLARYGTIDEIANVVYFLCSQMASYVNGQIIAVDGGFDAAGVGLPSLRGE
jgi:meso-butanediol dehydrogenase / (S,S)-butanediol dehydrogenase / diacetyl reductase